MGTPGFSIFPISISSVSAAMAETNANYAANTASTYTANGTYSGVTGSLFEGLV